MTFMDDPIYEIQEIRAMWRQILAGGGLKDDKIDKVLIAQKKTLVRFQGMYYKIVLISSLILKI